MHAEMSVLVDCEAHFGDQVRPRVTYGLFAFSETEFLCAIIDFMCIFTTLARE
jgi:hypothetical protein